MNGDLLITRARQILKDVPTNVAQGQFWADREIILALNAAQDIFLNFAIENKLHYMLAGLVTNTQYMTTQRNFTFDPPYLHYISARTGDFNNQKPARIYLGAEGANYEHTHHKAIAIIGNDVYVLDGNQLIPRDGQGFLFYYKRPSYIGATSLGDNPNSPLPPIVPRTDFFNVDFENYIYNDIFANHAAVILGAKETTTQRDYKKLKRNLSELILNPPIYANYVRNIEFTGEINAGRPEEPPQPRQAD